MRGKGGQEFKILKIFQEVNVCYASYVTFDSI